MKPYTVKKLWIPVVLAVILLLLVLLEPVQQPRTYMNVNREIPYAGEIPVQHDYLSWDSRRRPGEVRDIMYITIHETDNTSPTADASAHAAFLRNITDSPNGWHYTVDDHSIVHHIPDNEIAYNAGDGRTPNGGNMNGIGIEMCVNDGGDYEQTLRNTAVLCAELMAQYGLNVGDIRFHADFMEKECPHRLISEGRVDEFLQMVQEEADRRQ